MPSIADLPRPPLIAGSPLATMVIDRPGASGGCEAMAGHSKWSEIKRRKGLTEGRERARQASLRTIAGGDRPVYRPQVEPDGDLLLVRIQELEIATQARQPDEVSAMARDCIATWLGVDPDAFDVETEI